MPVGDDGKRRRLSMLAGVATLVLLGPPTVMGLLLVAGPHSSLAPLPVQMILVLVLFAIPPGVALLVARTVWRRGRVPAGDPARQRRGASDD